MTNEEFSNQLDTLLNSYNIQAGFGEGASKQGITLDEYEKSVLLTQAQDNIVKSYFYKDYNNQGQGFDDSSRRQVDFSSLIKNKRYNNLVQNPDRFDSRGYSVTLDPKVLFVLNEKLEVTTDSGIESDKEEFKTYVVVPINYKEYDREMSKAYAQPLKKQAWRLFSNLDTQYDIDSEIIPIYGTTKNGVSNQYGFFQVRYIGPPLEGADINRPKTYYYNKLLAERDYNKTLSMAKKLVTRKSMLPPLDNLEAGSIIGVRNIPEGYCALDYVIRYVERPAPIILVDLPDGLSIDGISLKSECTLNPVLHVDIINEAFRLAVMTRGKGIAQRQQNNDNQRQ